MYDVVSTRLKCGSTSIDVSDLAASIQRLTAPGDRQTRLNGLDRQFKVSNAGRQPYVSALKGRVERIFFFASFKLPLFNENEVVFIIA